MQSQAKGGKPPWLVVMMDGQPTTPSDAEAARVARIWAVANAMLSRADVRPHSPSAFGGRSVASVARGGGRGLEDEGGQTKPAQPEQASSRLPSEKAQLMHTRVGLLSTKIPRRRAKLMPNAKSRPGAK